MCFCACFCACLVVRTLLFAEFPLPLRRELKVPILIASLGGVATVGPQVLKTSSERKIWSAICPELGPLAWPFNASGAFCNRGTIIVQIVVQE
jgi:hypothetical protein